MKTLAAAIAVLALAGAAGCASAPRAAINSDECPATASYLNCHPNQTATIAALTGDTDALPERDRRAMAHLLEHSRTIVADIERHGPAARPPPPKGGFPPPR
jgi:hypothetical protein